MRDKKYYQRKKAFWQKYTEDKLSDNDIDEINLNLRDFAKAVLDIHRELKSSSSTQEPEDRQKEERIDK